MKPASPRRALALWCALSCIGALGCASTRGPTPAGAPDAKPPVSPTTPPGHADIATAPLPAPPRAASTELVEAWRLSDALATTAVDTGSTPDSEADLRQWAIEGFMPREGAKKSLLLRATQLLRAAASSASTEEQAIGAALAGRMEESLASDWNGLHVIECVADPTVCRWASVVIDNAKRAWLDRALERYEACVDLARDPRLAAWARFCDDRIVLIHGLSLMRTRGVTRP